MNSKDAVPNYLWSLQPLEVTLTIRLRTEFHRHETPDGVLTWTVAVQPKSAGGPRCGRPREFELDGEPLTVSQGRSLKLRHEITD